VNDCGAIESQREKTAQSDRRGGKPKASEGRSYHFVDEAE
jgi:hypothetical protein